MVKAVQSARGVKGVLSDDSARDQSVLRKVLSSDPTPLTPRADCTALTILNRTIGKRLSRVLLAENLATLPRSFLSFNNFYSSAESLHHLPRTGTGLRLASNQMSCLSSPEEDVFINHGSAERSRDPEKGCPESPRQTRFDSFRQTVRSRCCDEHYRRLSIFSVVCGLSCLSVCALKYSVQSEERKNSNPKESKDLAKKAKKFSLCAIFTLFLLLAIAPALMALVSYLATFQD
ncbi:hypothetical protein WMY93_001602 [Mugilogobius chulae]|uniref:Transmembrane protein n=1 Tax=Mugilogobius chulae TaxID=88201 RepID=A0AAW0PR77_9GOBI